MCSALMNDITSLVGAKMVKGPVPCKVSAILEDFSSSANVESRGSWTSTSNTFPEGGTKT